MRYEFLRIERTALFAASVAYVSASVVYEGWSESSVKGAIIITFLNRYDGLLYYTLIERGTFRLYNDAKLMQERNK